MLFRSYNWNNLKRDKILDSDGNWNGSNYWHGNSERMEN
jgi:hypothetical protein